MVAKITEPQKVNVIISEANWAWPEALKNIFRPRGVNLLVARSPNDFINIIEREFVHTAIVDMDSDKVSGLAAVRVIRVHNPILPCILLARCIKETTLSNALELNVFSVIEKPVDMGILKEQLNRLFLKKYQSRIFAK